MPLFVGCLRARRTLSFPGRRTVPCVRVSAPPSHASPASKGAVPPPSPGPSSCGQESAPSPTRLRSTSAVRRRWRLPCTCICPALALPRTSSAAQTDTTPAPALAALPSRASMGTQTPTPAPASALAPPSRTSRRSEPVSRSSPISRDAASSVACARSRVPTRPTRACWASSSAGFLPVQVPVGGVAHPISVSRRSPPSPTRSRRKTLGGKGPASRCARAGRTATEAPSFAADRDTFPPCDRQSRYSVLTASSAALLRSTPVTAERAASNFHPLVR
ncbi:hypothetical protein B0H13DRAFT_2032909 [Mycena leptocephala]|nr:hypothetical protein B0H13DRAFT_2032909 [Mycena leptocephala]